MSVMVYQGSSWLGQGHARVAFFVVFEAETGFSVLLGSLILQRSELDGTLEAKESLGRCEHARV